jgi:hypothetical protein
MPGTIGTSELRRITSSMAFGGAGGMASYLRTVKAPITQITPVPSVPSPPSRGGGGSSGGGGRGGPREVHVTGDGPLFQAFMRMVRAEVRRGGGNVQAVLEQ